MRKETTDGQLKLLFCHTADSLKHYLEEGLGKSVCLILTKNSTSMLSAGTRDGVMQIRLSRIFLNAGNDVIEEIVSFLKKKKSKMLLFHKFVRENGEQLRTKPPKNISLKSMGKFHDLRELYDEINRNYFGGLVSAAITWGSRSPRYAVRKRTLGSYSARPNLIRINPVLDRKSVPHYYIAFVVYHEMLHAAIGILEKGGRRSVHSKEFKKRERLFKDYEKAVVWERGATQRA